MPTLQLPLPQHFDVNQVDKVWRIPYQERQREALTWAEQHSISPRIRGRFSDVSPPC